MTIEKIEIRVHRTKEQIICESGAQIAYEFYANIHNDPDLIDHYKIMAKHEFQSLDSIINGGIQCQ